MSINSRLEKLERRVSSQADLNNNLVPLTIPWPDEDGGPIHCLVKPEFIEGIVKIYGHHSQQTNPKA